MKKKKTVTVPRIYKPGPGHPAETLAYLNPMEHELIRQLTDGTYQRGPKGVKSYADDSASSNGVSRGDNSGTKGSGGLGQGGQGSGGTGGSSGSQASNSPGGGVSTGGSGVTGSKGGGASSQSPGMGNNEGRVTSGGLSSAAKSLQDQRTTAMGRVSQVANAVANSSRAPNAAAQYAYDRQAVPSNSSPQTAKNGSYYGPKGINALNTDARMAAARSVGFNAPAVTRTPGDAEMLGRMMMAESSSIRNPLGGVNTTGLQGVADVVRNRMASERFPDTVPDVLGQRKQFSPMADGSFKRTPANEMATRVAESVLSGESPSVVGNALNYGNLDTINNLTGYSSAATKAAFNSMQPTATIADARNPNSRSHTFGTIGAPSDVAFNGPGSYNPNVPAGTQVAGLTNAGLSQAAEQARARKAAEGLNAIQNAATPSSFVSDPRLSVPQGAFPASPLRSAAGTYTAPYNPPTQGPQRYSGPNQSIPAPNSIGINGPPSSFVSDPRLGVPQGAYPAQARSQVPTDPRLGLQGNGFPAARNPISGMSYTPDLPAQMPQSAFVRTDPRTSLTPLGSLPAAQKPAEVAWNVPPMGGALPGPAAWGLGQWGTNRPLPKGPAATPGVSGSQTASAAPNTTTTDSAPSLWETGSSWVKAKTDQVTKAVKDVQADPNYQKLAALQKVSPGLAEALVKMAMGGGGAGGGLLGNPQDRSDQYFRPQQAYQPQQTAMRSASEPTVSEQLQSLLQLQQDLVARGASPEELATVQAMIAELAQTQEA